MADSVLASMAVKIAANVVDFKKGLNDVKGQLSSFTSSVTKVAGTVGLAFGIREVGNFAVELSRIAGETEGVKAAFDKLPDSIKLMADLKTATAGTVSELDLMKRTVQASNFGIALESLPDLLKFASLRAQQTGQSVDYLVDSIVTGIGRKSPLILDNLGISAVRLKAQFGGAALEAQSIGDVAKAVGKIATEELQKMGDFSENASTKMQRLAAEWENFKGVLGAVVNESGVVTDSIELITYALKNLARAKDALNGGGGDRKGLSAIGALSTGFQIATGTKQIELLKDGLKALEEYQAKQETLEGKVEAFNQKLAKNPAFNKTVEGIVGLQELGKAAELVGKKLVVVSDETQKTMVFIRGWSVTNAEASAANVALATTLETLQAKLKGLNDDFEKADINDTKNLANIGKQIIALDAQIKKINELRKAQETYGNTLAGLEKRLTALNDEYSKIVFDTSQSPSPDADKRLNQISQEIQAIQALIAKLNALKKTRDESIVTRTAPLKTTGKVGNVSGINDDDTSQRYANNVSLFDGDKAVEEINKRAQRIKKANVDATHGIQQAWIDTAGIVSGAISDISYSFGQSLAGVGNFGDSIIAAMAAFAKQLGEILIASGTAMLAAKVLIKNPYTAIAAGVALVAIAGAAAGALQKSQSKFSSGGSVGSSGGSSFSYGSGGSTGYQNSNPPTLVGVIRGHDLYIMLQNYNRGRG